MRRGAQHGTRNHQWKGGRVVASNGYVLVRVGSGHRLADVRGYAYEHRLVAEGKVGRPLADAEQVHHIDGDKTNNDPANLEVVSVAEHRFHHRESDRGMRRPGEDNPNILCACGCGEIFPKYDRHNRPRAYVSGHNEHPAPTLDALAHALSTEPRQIGDIARTAGVPLRRASTGLGRLKRSGRAVSGPRGYWRKVA